MSYRDLAEHLVTLAKTVADNHARLEGVPLAKAAEGLEKAAAKFEIKLKDFLGGRGPGIRELEEMLKSPQAKAHLPLPGLNIVCRSVFGSALSAEKLPAAKKEFFEKVKKEQAGERAVVLLKEFFFKAAQMPPPSADKVALQNELLRLGGLSDDELKFEFSSRLKAVGILKKLAQANSLPVSKGAKKGDLIDVITHYARRAYANIAHRA